MNRLRLVLPALLMVCLAPASVTALVHGKAGPRGEARALRARGIAFIISLLLMTHMPLPAQASSYLPRKVAKRVAADSIAKVRRNIGTNPSLVASYLIETLAVPIGDDPRVLELCKEILSKSTGTVETRAVASALFTIVNSHVGFFTSGARKAAIAEPLRKLLAYPDRQVQLMAADSLGGLGGAFREEAARYYLDLLETPNPISITTEPERSDIHTEAIRRLLNMDSEKFYAPIKSATVKFDLLARFKKWIAEDPERRLKFSRNDEFLKKWEAVMKQDGT